jgi:diguanylate cyclase (GGDEF)-like protein
MLSNEKRSKILIVDDEKINIDILVGLLKPHYQTVAARNGQQALKRLEKKPIPDLILLDIMMPGMDGYEVCRKIKDNPLTRDIPVIFITGKNDEQDEARGFMAGAVDYITKPFSPLVALSRVNTHIELKRRGDLLEKMALLDGLTEIPNRRQFDLFLDSEWKRSIRYVHNISLILIDIDNFKLYNDHYGHSKGDDCLKKIATAITRAMPRCEDLAARYGGEEFACILPETGVEGGVTVGNRILSFVGDLAIAHEKSPTTDHVTVSIGIASVIPTSNDQSCQLLESADEALYKAKQNGRNRIVVFNESE